MLTDEETPFITAPGDEEEKRTTGRRMTHRRFGYPMLHKVACLFHILLVTLNVTIFATLTKPMRAYHESDDMGLDRRLSSSKAALEYVFEEGQPPYEPSPFVGQPREELDQAWDNLLRSKLYH
ncbi:hypothetical protein GGR57DRAFT_510710 [Xylariaceae sp. FL1272]|nr:hypothetical protein GGR57DRAFT_510710 [Xylariaceae sp. FL1272]